MIIENFSVNILIVISLFIGSINLVTPFISKQDSTNRSLALLCFSFLFLISVIGVDYAFLYNPGEPIIIASFGHYSIALHAEPLGLIFFTMLAALWFCALLYTIKFLHINEINNSSRFLFFLNLCVLIGCLIALSGNLFTMFIGYEILTLCTIPLIAHNPNKYSIEGLFKYLKILMISALMLFLPALIIIYTYAGHGDFVSGGIIKGVIADQYVIIILVMLIAGCAKAAIYPFHSWLPAAMVASYPVSALLHAVVVVKTGLFCIYKILYYTFGLEYLAELFSDFNWLVILPMITIIYSSFQAIRYTKVKMVLAYSTINQLSIALVSAFLLTPKGFSAAILHMISHSFTKICIFYAAGNIYSVKNSYDIKDLIGIRDTMPKTSFVMLIAGLSLIGVPPFAGFISKFYIMLAAAEANNFLVMSIIGISTLFSALYMLKILIFIYRPTSEEFILHLRLKPYFDESSKYKNTKRIVSSKHKAEEKLPQFMILSITLCMCGVVFFAYLEQLIRNILFFI